MVLGRDKILDEVSSDEFINQFRREYRVGIFFREERFMKYSVGTYVNDFSLFIHKIGKVLENLRNRFLQVLEKILLKHSVRSGFVF